MAFLANTCVQIIRSYGYSYYPSSFARISFYQLLRQAKDSLPPTISNTPVQYMRHNSFIPGEQVIRPGADGAHESGYQVLRLATEILPATFAVMGADQVSPFWAVLTYFILIMFGIAQQLAIRHCVITGIMAIKPKLRLQLYLGLPMATELGIYVVYFMNHSAGKRLVAGDRHRSANHGLFPNQRTAVQRGHCRNGSLQPEQPQLHSQLGRTAAGVRLERDPIESYRWFWR
ncbi:hypothetical protein YQE_00942, partial [Dendroctonus ponderosae]